MRLDPDLKDVTKQLPTFGYSSVCDNYSVLETLAMAYPNDLSITPEPVISAQSAPDGDGGSVPRRNSPIIDILEITMFNTNNVPNVSHQSQANAADNSKSKRKAPASPHPAFSDFFEFILTGNFDKLQTLLSDSSVDIDIDAPLDLDYIREDSSLWTSNHWLRYSSSYWEDVARGCTGLYLAAYKNFPTIVQLLLDHGGDPQKIVDIKAESALHIACKFGHVEIVRILLVSGMNPDIRDMICDGVGNTPLLVTVACFNPSIDLDSLDQIDDHYLQIAKALIAAGCDVNSKDDAGIQPLHLSATKPDTAMTELLINAGANLNVASLHAATPLIRALRHHAYDNMCLLLAAGADVNQAVWPGTTALSVGMEDNYLPGVLPLLVMGAKLGVTTHAHDLEYAITGRHLVNLWLLLCYGQDPDLQYNPSQSTLLIRLTQIKCNDGVDLLLRYGADINLDNRLGTTPLWAAVDKDNLHLVHLFLEHNCCLTIPSLEHQVLRPLIPVQLAIEKGFFQVARTLLQAGSPLMSNWIATTGRNISEPLLLNPAEQAWLREWLYSTRSLQYFCVIHIRAILGAGIKAKLRSLTNYPTKLKLYILKPWLL